MDEELEGILNSIVNLEKSKTVEEQLEKLEKLNEDIIGKVGAEIPQIKLAIAMAKFNMILEKIMDNIKFDFSKSHKLEMLLNQFIEILEDFRKEN